MIDTLREIAARSGRTCSQVAINFLLCRSPRVIPIFGARTMDQLAENLGGADWRLTEEEAGIIGEASSIPVPYPYRFIQRYTRRRDGSGPG